MFLSWSYVNHGALPVLGHSDAVVLRQDQQEVPVEKYGCKIL